MNTGTSSGFGWLRSGVAACVASVLVACSPAPKTAQPAADQAASVAPTVEQRTELAPLLSAELIDLLQRADAARTAARAAAPMEKPHFTDGDLFSSLFEGPTAFTVGEPQTGAAGEWRVPVTLTYSTGAKDEKPTEWTDTVVLREESGRFVVTDIAFGGSWDFANKGTMLEALRAGLAGQ